MAMHPEVQRKAQAELDAVIDSHRTPSFDDRDHLPYVNALITECLRWRPTAHLGIPHASVADNEFEGYIIPKGSVLVANVW